MQVYRRMSFRGLFVASPVWRTRLGRLLVTGRVRLLVL